MSAVPLVPHDLRLIYHASLSDSYEMSKVLLATAGFDGHLQLLTSGWERVLGYGRRELAGKTLCQLMWSNRRTAAAAVAAILESTEMVAVALRLRCRDGRGKGLLLHRRYDRQERVMYIVADEIHAPGAGLAANRAERRAAGRHA